MNENKDLMYNVYAVKIIAQLQLMFDDEDGDNYIDLGEVHENDSANHLIHALATVAPNVIIGYLTEQKMDPLEFNHLANRMAAQFMKYKEED